MQQGDKHKSCPGDTLSAGPEHKSRTQTGEKLLSQERNFILPNEDSDSVAPGWSRLGKRGSLEKWNVRRV